MNTYVVTNRRLDDTASRLDRLTRYPSEQGPNELRLVHITKPQKQYRVEVLDDQLSPDEVAKLKKEFQLTINERADWYASLAVACRLFRRAVREGKHILFFVHGYNNDVADILDTAAALEKAYKVIAVPFSWPANGGGAISGKLAYLDDKQDARASSDALNRVIGKINQYFRLLTEAQRNSLMKDATDKHRDNPTMQRVEFATSLDRHCSVTINMLCHSMGNYVMKQALLPSGTHSQDLVFDNVILAAAADGR